MTQTAVQPQRTPPPEIAEFCRRAVEALRAKLPVREVWLFGSYAEGKAKPDSDVDLFVVLADDHGLKRPSLECYSVVSELKDRPATDVTMLTETYWNHPRYRSFGLWADVAEKGVCVFRHGKFNRAVPVTLPPMPGDPTLPETWFDRARRDLFRARLILREIDAEGAIIPLQQSAEKVMKGWLIECGWRLVKTHSLPDLTAEVAERGVVLDWFEADANLLTEASIYAGYPGDNAIPSQEETEAIASNVERLFSELGINL